MNVYFFLAKTQENAVKKGWIKQKKFDSSMGGFFKKCDDLYWILTFDETRQKNDLFYPRQNMIMIKFIWQKVTISIIRYFIELFLSLSFAKKNIYL